jgi:hypothetical protein
MKPGSFDPVTAREIVGDALARIIETKARADADKRVYDPPRAGGATYWDCVTRQMEVVIYQTQYGRRAARNDRKRAAGC